MKMDIFKSCKAVVSMLLVQAFATGMQLLSKVILNNGTFIFALMTYRHVVAAICVTPFALYFERDGMSRLNKRVWIWIFSNALVGVLGTIFIIIGLYSFLWGKRKETEKLSQNNPPTRDVESGITISATIIQPTGVIMPESGITKSVTIQLTRVIMPDKSLGLHKGNAIEQGFAGNKVSGPINDMKP